VQFVLTIQVCGTICSMVDKNLVVMSNLFFIKNIVNSHARPTTRLNHQGNHKTIKPVLL